MPLPTEQEATTLGKQVPGTDRGTAQGPWWAGSEATRLNPQACVPPMPHPHPTADTIPLVDGQMPGGHRFMLNMYTAASAVLKSRQKHRKEHTATAAAALPS